MDLETDFKELLKLFNAHGVKYLVVGAYALAQHGVPRYTGDLDILVQPISDNAGRVEGHYGDVPVGFLGREQLITNKRAAGRMKHLADLEALGAD